MNSIHFKGERILKKSIVISIIVAIICLSYSIFYRISENDHQAQIQNEAISVIDTLKQDDGVRKIDLKMVCRYPAFFPSENEYIIFVDVIYDSLRKRNEDEWVKYIVGDGKINSIYAKDYIYYTQSVKMTDSEKINPIIITVSDDVQNFCLEKKYSFSSYIDDIDDLKIGKYNAVNKAESTSGNRYKSISMLLGIVFFLMATFLVCLYRKNRSEFKSVATKFYAECQEKGISENDVPKLKEVSAFYAKNSGVTNFEDAVSEIYLLVKNGFAKEKKKNNQKSKGKLISVFGVILAVVIIGGIIVYNSLIVPAKKYEMAIAMKNNGDMESAYSMFLELGNYKDSKTQCDEYYYSKAIVYYSAGQFAKCYQELAKIEGYEPAIELLNKIKTDHPYVDILTANVGDTVVIGEYEQDNNKSNGKEPIEWTVLGYEGDKMLLISKYILDAQPFNTSNSLECTLDDWITDTFFLDAFSNTKIDENIICAMLFFDGDQDLYFSGNNYDITSPTEYAKNISGYEKVYRGVYGTEKVYSYWLAGDVFGDVLGEVQATVGLETGIENNCADVQEIYGVRPTLWICPGGETTFPATATYSGKVPKSWSSSSCYTCNGNGVVKYYYGSSALEAWLSGYDDYEFGPCPSCHGSGKTK